MARYDSPVAGSYLGAQSPVVACLASGVVPDVVVPDVVVPDVVVPDVVVPDVVVPDDRVVWDFDGVIADTEPAQCAAYEAVLESFGVVPPPDWFAALAEAHSVPVPVVSVALMGVTIGWCISDFAEDDHTGRAAVDAQRAAGAHVVVYQEH